VLPEVGLRWPLSRAEGGFVIEQRKFGRTLRFASGACGVFLLASITDRAGNSIEIDRDGSGIPAAIRHSGGYHVDVIAEAGRITGYLLRNGDGALPLLRFGYNQAVSEVVNSSTLLMRFEYDLAGRIIRRTDRNGHWYSYLYDALGRCIANQGADGFRNGTFDYAPTSRTTEFTDAVGHTTV
jgi:YD repeat-containing protein